MACEDQCAGRLLPRWLNSMIWERLYRLYDPVVIVKIDQIDRREPLGGRNPPKRCQPKPRVSFDGEVLHENFQLLGGRIGNNDAQTQKALSRLVIHTVSAGFHDLRLFRKLPG